MRLDKRSADVREVAVILNEGSGAGGNIHSRNRIHTLFAAAGWETQIYIAGRSAPPDRVARDAVERGARILVAAGGDGTVSAVASSLPGSDAILGVLPMGTLNHFAKDLHIPFNLEEAVGVITRGKTTHCDIGEVNGRTFVNNSSLGLYPSMVFERDLQRRTGRSKWTAMFWASLTVLRRFQSVRVRLNIGGETRIRTTPFVFIGNNEYQIEGLNVGSRGSVNSGLLSLYVAQPASRARVIWLSLIAIFGRLRTEKDFEVFSLQETWIETRHKRLRISLDGEIAKLRTPLHYRIHAGALRVLVP
ncbi:MAG: diacylglycerol kinase family protein [Bryobacteraceae bacterium]